MVIGASVGWCCSRGLGGEGWGGDWCLCWSAALQVVNHHLMKDLTELGLWNEAMKHKLIAHGGSVQSIDEIPAHIKRLYKTVWEISQKVSINMAADRGAFIDQSQSLNMYIAEPNFGKLTSMHFYAWNKVCVGWVGGMGCGCVG